MNRIRKFLDTTPASTKFGYFFTVLLIVILASVVGVIGYYTYSDANLSVQEVQIANRTDTAITITWTSAAKYIGKVYYQESAKPWPRIFAQSGRAVSYDDRDVELSQDGEYVTVADGQKKRYTHHVTLRNLKPETEYSFRMGGKINGHEASVHKFTTLPLIEDLKTPEPGYGQVEGIKEGDSIALIGLKEPNETNTTLVSAPLERGTYSVDMNFFNLEEYDGSDFVAYIYTAKDKVAPYEFKLPGYKPFEKLTLAENSQSKQTSPLIKRALAQARGSRCDASAKCIDENNGGKDETECWSGVAGSDGKVDCKCLSGAIIQDVPVENGIANASDECRAVGQSTDSNPETTQQSTSETANSTGSLGSEGSPFTCSNKSSICSDTFGSGYSCSDSFPSNNVVWCERGSLINGFSGYCLQVGSQLVGNDATNAGCRPSSNNRTIIDRNGVEIASAVNSIQDGDIVNSNSNASGNSSSEVPEVLSGIENCSGSVDHLNSVELSTSKYDLQEIEEVVRSVANYTEICRSEQTVENAIPRYKFSCKYGPKRPALGTTSPYIQCAITSSPPAEVPLDLSICNNTDAPVNVFDTIDETLVDNAVINAYSVRVNPNSPMLACMHSQSGQRRPVFYCQYNQNRKPEFNLGDRSNKCPLAVAAIEEVNIGGGSEPPQQIYISEFNAQTKEKISDCNAIDISQIEDNGDTELIANLRRGGNGSIINADKHIYYFSNLESCRSGTDSVASQISPQVSGWFPSQQLTFPRNVVLRSLAGGNCLQQNNFNIQKEIIQSEIRNDVMEGKGYYIVKSNSGELYMFNNMRDCSMLKPTGLGKSILGAVVAQTNNPQTSLEINESGRYAFFKDNEIVADQDIIINADRVEVRLFSDKNGNGVKDPDEDFYQDYTNIKLSKQASAESFSLNSGWNLLHLPLVDNRSDKPVRKAGDLIDYWNKQGADIKHIARFANGQFELFSKRESGTEYSNNFNLIPGQGLFVLNLANQREVVFSGNKFEASVPLTLSQGWNLVGVVAPGKTYNSEQLLKAFGEQQFSVSTLSQFENGLYKSVVLEDNLIFGNNFNLIDKRGYFIKVEDGGGKKFTP